MYRTVCSGSTNTPHVLGEAVGMHIKWGWKKEAFFLL